MNTTSWHILINLSLSNPFSVLILLVGRQEGHSACNRDQSAISKVPFVGTTLIWSNLPGENRPIKQKLKSVSQSL